MSKRSAKPLHALATWLLGAALASFSGGCGHGEEGCPEVCEQTAACVQGTPEDSCLDACEAAQKKAEDQGCGDQFEAQLECLGHLDDICAEGATDECTIQIQAYEKCKAG